MKKILILLLASIVFATSTLAVDKNSAEYLRSKKHLSPMNSFVENIVQQEIRRSLKKTTGADFKVKFKAYNISSLKAGIFKYIEIIGNDITAENIFIPYVKLYSMSDYNRIDYTVNPIKMKSDMVYVYNINLSEQSLNDALKLEDYQKVIQKVNKRAYPMFAIYDVKIRIKNNKVYVIMDYNFPIKPARKNRTFFVSADFGVQNGIIKIQNIGIDKAYGNVPLDKVANLINLLDPLSFALDVLNTKNCKGVAENIKIVDDILQIDGKIYIKGE